MSIFSRLSNPFRRESAADRHAWIQDSVSRAARAAMQPAAASLRAASRSFETAETPAWTNSWSTSAGDLNDDLSRQLPTLRGRSRQLARNNEWAARYLLQLDDNVLGDQGIRLQMRVKTAAGGFDKATNAALEGFFGRWCARGACEVSGKHDWREVESLLLASLARNGEILYRRRPGNGPFGFRIQMLPPELLDVSLRRDWGGNRVRMGVELTNDGEPVAYWLRAAKAGDALDGADITTVGRHVRVPASEICHRFEATEIDQVRGIPWLTVGARRLWLLHDFEESAAVASSNAAKRQGFFVSPDGNAPPGFADVIISSVLDAAKASGKVLTPEEIQAITSAAEKYATTMPGQFDTLPQGYDFKPFESKWPEISADGYIKQQVRGWAAARGVSYHTLGNDLESVNYSSAQVGIVDEREHYKRLQGRLAAWLHADVIEHVLRRAPLYVRELKPSRLEEYLAAVTWQPRRWAPIDPNKAANSDDTQLRNKTMSRRRIWLAKGLDPDEMAEEIAEDERQFGPLEAVQPAVRQARLAEPTDEGEGGRGG